MAGVYRSSPNSNSGGRYHKVMTLLVYGRLNKEQNKTNKQKNSLELVSVRIREILLGNIILANQSTPPILAKTTFVCLLNRDMLRHLIFDHALQESSMIN